MNKNFPAYLLKNRLLIAGLLFSMIVVAILSGFTVGMITPIVSTIFGEHTVGRSPLIFGWLFNWIGSGSKINSLFRLAFALVLIYAVKLPFSILLTYLGTSLEQNTITDIRENIFGKLLSFSYGYHTGRNTGRILSGITNDTEKLRFAIDSGIVKLGEHFFTLLVYAGLAFWASWRLFAVTAVVLPPVVFGIKKLGGRIRGKFSSLAGLRGVLNSMVDEMLRGIKIIKLHGKEDREKNKFRKESGAFRKKYIRSHTFRKSLPFISEFFGALLAGLILIGGGIFIHLGYLTPDRFLIFLGSVVLLQYPARQAYLSYGDLQEGMASLEEINSILEKGNRISDRGKIILKDFNSSIVYDNVSCNFTGESPVLETISFKINRGEVVGVVGRSGSGKTTLVNLLPRFLEPSSGKIMLDGVDIRKYTLKSLRSVIGMVSQDVILFNDTIKNNILYAKTEAGERELQEAIERSHLGEFVERISGGLHRKVGESGIKLSGGEKQRIAIARVILKNPPIVILDEATTSLDAESGNLVREAIYELFESRTVIIISHDLNLMEDTDKIIVLSEGKIVEEGKHFDLLDKGGLYGRLFDLQSRKDRVS